MAERRVASLDTECRAVKERAASLEARERDARQNAQTAAAELIKVTSFVYLLCLLDACSRRIAGREEEEGGGGSVDRIFVVLRHFFPAHPQE